MHPCAVDMHPSATRHRQKLGPREQVLGAKQPGERGDAELAPALRLLAKVLLTQQRACAALLFLLSAWYSSTDPGAAELALH